MTDISRLKELLEIAVGDKPLPWRVWTSCSFRRVSCDATHADGDVLHAYNQRSDNHPDLSMPEDQLQAWIKLTNTLPDLLATIDRLREENERLARNRDMWKGQCERQAEALTFARDLANKRHGLLIQSVERCISAIAAYCRNMNEAGKEARFSDLPLILRALASGEGGEG